MGFGAAGAERGGREVGALAGGLRASQQEPKRPSAVRAALEAMHRVLRSDAAPLMTRFLAYSLATPHWFDLTAAKRDLDYRPRVSVAEGLKRLREARGSRRGARPRTSTVDHTAAVERPSG